MILWDILLELKSKIEQLDSIPSIIQVYFTDKNEVSFVESAEGADFTIRINQDCNDPLSHRFFEISLASAPNIKEKDIALLRLYFPYTCLKHFSIARGKCFAVSHFAQTLDGKIATSTGDSKWIGNEENLIHAHRMRALCDGIMIGSNTLEIDNPKLNVRKVRGENPIKVIIGGNGELQTEKLDAINSDTIVFREKSIPGEGYQCIEIPRNPLYNASKILRILAEKDIHSVYIEGGSFTTSCFLRQRQLDQIQLHFSNKILGSGVSSFSLDGIATISDAVTFGESEYFHIGNEMMFVGKINR